MGVPGTAVTTADELVAAMERAIAEPGPHLIEAILPQRKVDVAPR
jgi:acetolactate synthase-1/2/3 large subunit